MDKKQLVSTFRLSVDQYEELALAAQVVGISVSELIREAIADYLDIRRSDPEFRRRVLERLAERVTADQEALDRFMRRTTLDSDTP